MNPWGASWPRQPSWLGPATRCSWPPGAPRWTCSPTTPPAATRSPRRCGSADLEPAAARGERSGDDHREPRGRRARRFELRRDPGRQLLRAVATAASAPARSWFGALRAALDRPLTAYYLLLGASALLLTIGLIMVLSASSVYSYEVNDGDSYAVVRRQLLWVLIGLPLAWLASRLPHRWVRRLAYPGFAVSLGLLLLTAFFGVEVNGNQNWLGVGPSRSSPPRSPSSRW